jgi:hypothetical protein
MSLWGRFHPRRHGSQQKTTVALSRVRDKKEIARVAKNKINIWVYDLDGDNRLTWTPHQLASKYKVCREKEWKDS